jgi:hypothetical protein
LPLAGPAAGEKEVNSTSGTRQIGEGGPRG